MSTSAPGTRLKGIVFYARHGDRTAFHQNPFTYAASDTTITPLGTAQEFNLGELLRSIYLTPSSPKFIQGIMQNSANQNQIKVRADAGDEGGVNLDSSIALLQGLFPPNSRTQRIKLGNGTTVVSPLGGYEYIPIESVEANQDISLEGHADCTNWSKRVARIYRSPAFRARAKQAEPFLKAVRPFLHRRPDTAINAYNIYDFVNVESLHDPHFHKIFPTTLLLQARDLANFHEWILYTDPVAGGIGNIDAYTIIPSLLNGLARVADNSDPLKIHYSAISYKPFISLFNLTAADPLNRPVTPFGDDRGGLVDYASAVVLEVYEDDSLKMVYKNGTKGFVHVPLNSSLNTVSGFTNALAPLGINNTFEWCKACGNHVDRGCSVFFGGGDPLDPLSVSRGSATMTDHAITSRLTSFATDFMVTFSTLAFVLVVLVAKHFVSGRKEKKDLERRVSADYYVEEMPKVTH